MFDQSCVNRTELVQGTLRFLFLSHPLYRICVKMFITNRYISTGEGKKRNEFVEWHVAWLAE